MGDAKARGSANDVVAVEDGIELERRVDSGVGFGCEALNVFDGEVFEFAATGDAMAHGDAQITETLSDREREELLELLRKVLDIKAFRPPRIASNDPPPAAL